MPPQPAGDLALAHTHLRQAAKTASLFKREVAVCLSHGDPGHSRCRTSISKSPEAFLDQDLSELDFAAFKPLTWESEPKTARVNMRLPQPLTCAIKARAAERSMPPTRA